MCESTPSQPIYGLTHGWLTLCVRTKSLLLLVSVVLLQVGGSRGGTEKGRAIIYRRYGEREIWVNPESAHIWADPQLTHIVRPRQKKYPIINICCIITKSDDREGVWRKEERSCTGEMEKGRDESTPSQPIYEVTCGWLISRRRGQPRKLIPNISRRVEVRLSWSSACTYCVLEIVVIVRKSTPRKPQISRFNVK